MFSEENALRSGHSAGWSTTISQGITFSLQLNTFHLYYYFILFSSQLKLFNNCTQAFLSLGNFRPLLRLLCALGQISGLIDNRISVLPYSVSSWILDIKKPNYLSGYPANPVYSYFQIQWITWFLNLVLVLSTLQLT